MPAATVGAAENEDQRRSTQCSEVTRFVSGRADRAARLGVVAPPVFAQRRARCGHALRRPLPGVIIRGWSCGAFQPARSRCSSPISSGRRRCFGSSAPSGTRPRLPRTGNSCVRRLRPTEVSRWTPRAMRSSSRFEARERRWQRRKTHRPRSTNAGSGSGWDCTRVSPCSSTAVTAESRCTRRRASLRRDTGGQVLISETTRDLLAPSVLVRDLGSHRLKDLGEPVRLYQLGEAEFPPLRSLNSTNLPIQPTPLIGREQEVREAGRLLRAYRLVTLTGPGGSGKTRLALQLAAELVEDFPEGVIWVPLQTLHDPELVLPTIAGALGTTETLGEGVADRRVLLVLDNFEQVLASASRIGELLAQHPQLKLLVTSREPLHLGGEHEYPVAPLREREAVALFIARATAVRPDFVDDGAVVDIARRLDGLPLALELAAARVKALSAQELLKRLRQAASDPHRWSERRARTSAYAARDDRMELRPSHCG